MLLRLACDGDHSLVLVAAGCRRGSVGFHNFDVRLAAKSNFVYFVPTLANDTSDKTVRDENLLCLLLLWGIEMGRGCVRVVAVTGHIRRTTGRWGWGWWWGERDLMACTRNWKLKSACAVDIR